MATTLDTMTAANAVLATFASGWAFYRRCNGISTRIRLRCPGRDIPVQLRSDRLWLAHHHDLPNCGGTMEQAVVQLVLWVRGLPRKPLGWWKGWASHGMGSPETLSFLGNFGYEANDVCACVLCGNPDLGKVKDWWCLDGVVGPCCWGGECRKDVT